MVVLTECYGIVEDVGPGAGSPGSSSVHSHYLARGPCLALSRLWKPSHPTVNKKVGKNDH